VVRTIFSCAVIVMLASCVALFSAAASSHDWLGIVGWHMLVEAFTDSRGCVDLHW
jgi:hypothetical protein